MTSDKNLDDIISRFSEQRILVLGDFILDVFVRGVSTRLCPEAPVPVVDVTNRTICAGGAANTAANLIALGAMVTFCTVIGGDADGHEAISFLETHQCDTRAILQCPERKTIVKTRVVVGTQVITRIDDGTTDPIDDNIAERVVGFLRRQFSSYDAIILSDYDKGFFTEHIRNEIAGLQQTHQKFLVVDSKRLGFFKTLRPSIVKPNYEEAIRLLGMDHLASNRREQFRLSGDALHERTGAERIVITLDIEGSIVIEDGVELCHVKATTVTAPQVSGAGDAYISAFTLAYLAGLDVCKSAAVAAATAGIAITKNATANCTARELKSHFNKQEKYILLDALDDLCNAYRANGKRIIFTNGCFDILHSGHVAYLDSARELGDVLIVGMNTDESISRIKGPSRPVNRFQDRMAVVAGLKSVDHIVAFGEETDDTPETLIRKIRPDVFVKGGDYDIGKLPELAALREIGSEVVFVPRIPDRSTTGVIHKISQLMDVAAG